MSRSHRMLIALASCTTLLLAATPAHAGFSITNNITGGGPGGTPRATQVTSSSTVSSWDTPMEVP